MAELCHLYHGVMSTETERPPRADAVRNAGRILDAAREVFAETGPDASLEAVAKRAEVGARTVYRHFPDREALVRAALERSITAALAPVLERALAGDDPRAGLVAAMEATLELVSRERHVLAAATNSGALTAEVTAPVLGAVAELAARAQAAGTLRPDLTSDDIGRIMGMLTNVLWGMDQNDDSWRRYLGLMLDACKPEGASPLPHAAPYRPETQSDKCLP